MKRISHVIIYLWLSLWQVAPLALAAEHTWKDDMAAGEVAYKVGENKAAETCFLSALAKAEKFDDNDLRLAETLNDLGVIYDESKRYDEAEKVYKRALAVREKACGKDSGEVATTLNNLANLYKDQKKYSEAEPMYSRVLEIYVKVEGPDSQYMAMSYSNLASLYRVQGKSKEAIAAYKKALAAGEKSLGPENSHVVDIVSHLAQECDKDGDKVAAKVYYKRYLDSLSEGAGVRRKVATLLEMQQMAKTLRKEGHEDDAALIEKALKYEQDQ